MSRSLKFTNMVASRLVPTPALSTEKKCFRLIGKLDAGPVIVPIEIAVPLLFRDLKRSPPTAWCHAPWMRTGPDWHNLPPMCWVLPDEWRDVMGARGKPVRSIMDEGVDWLLTGVSSLVSRHYQAHLEGLDQWLPEWSAWGHGRAGVKEYQAEKRRAPVRAPRQQRSGR
jgi:hypothetical protein